MAVSQNSLLLFAASWLLLAVFLLPAQASAASPATTMAVHATLNADTIPLFDNNLTVNKANPVAEDLPGIHPMISYQLRGPSTLQPPGWRRADMDTLFRYLTEVAASP